MPVREAGEGRSEGREAQKIDKKGKRLIHIIVR